MQTAQYQREAPAPAQRRITSTPADDPFADPFAEPSHPAMRQSRPRSAARRAPQRIVSEPVLPDPLDDSPPVLPGEPKPLPPSNGDEKPCSLDSLKKLHDISLSIDAKNTPSECTLDEPYYLRTWDEKCYTWKASALCHKPLYFEDERFERYGMSRRPLLQPVVSGARFFGSAALLPYKMGIEHPFECVYALGYFRPGSCTPRFRKRIFPLDPEGVLYEAAAVAGGILLIP